MRLWPQNQPPEMLKDVDIAGTERAKVIATRIRRLEAIRGKTAPIYPGDPRLLRWVDTGISDAELREAYELAVTKLEDDQSLTPVVVSLIDPFVRDVMGQRWNSAHAC